MKKISINVEDKKYDVLIADTDETRYQGLRHIKHVPNNKGMLFVFEKPQKVQFTMAETIIPLLQAFLNEDMEVVKVLKRQPLDETLMGFDDIQYVLELNADEDVKEGDEMTIEDNNQKVPVMKIIGSDGNVQGVIQGGERIFSRANTKVLIRQAKKAYTSNSDSDYKRLGKSMFKYLKIQDNNTPQYVESPKNEEK